MKDWSNAERPREKLLRHGAQSLSNAELLAIFLRTGVQGVSVFELAQHLLAHFGDLHRLFNAPATAFEDIRGIGIAKYTQLQASLELAKRTFATEFKHTDILSNWQHLSHFVRLTIGHRHEECFLAIALNGQQQLIAHDILFVGTHAQTPIYPRTLIKWVLNHNANQLLIADNHPDGDPTPSQADLTLTQQLKTLLAHVDVHLLDHLICTSTHCISLAKQHLI